MMEPSPQSPNYLIQPISLSPPYLPSPSPPPPLPLEPPPPSPTPTKPNQFLSLISKRPSVSVTSEFDSESRIFFHRVSCKLFDNLAKLKFSFLNKSKREISEPQLALTSKHLSIHYDPEEQNALIKSSFDVGPMLHFKATHDVKAQQGEVAMIANSADTSYAVEVSSPVPYVGLDGAMSFIPSVSLPSNALSFAFKRRFSPSDKLSYWYNFDSNYWSAVYKHTYDKDYKFKAGYDSEVRLGWASLWVGDENGKAKTAPMKMKVQFMLQVPQDDIKSSMLMFRVKKRWDIL
ncbi:outer envelope pore protein 37, chloroplastic-like isoform X2 [Durio zibethinus]|uniref:Outer envelope pore protein 37, chloroplastic-like isoform X2 n=1 Tax=Durio zibethinus TaxID=66656 RepID=A0A6P6AEZ2_DURZI|nr:outer envelope pore protein 37, chloroplastic-like isoform X2 [Durio zibethinus]